MISMLATAKGLNFMTRPNILVVEDESILAEDIREMVEGFGYAVSGTASDGDEALARAAKHPPNLVLMDIMLKGKMQGIETAERMRSLYNVPVVYVTAYADDRTLKRARVTEPFGYIIKPFDERELRTTIAMALYKHEMEMKVKDSEERYRSFFEEDFSGHFISDAKGKILACNPAFARMLGFKSVANALKSSAYQFYHSQEARNGYLKELKTKKRIDNIERELIRKDGKKIRVISNVSGHFDEKGELVKISGFMLDITERKAAEENYRTLFEESKDAIVIYKPSGQFEEVNPAGVALFGYESREEFLKKAGAKLYVHARDRFELARQMEQDGFVKDFEITMKRKDGQRIIVLQTATAVRDGKGKITSVRAILRDVTEKKKLEEQLLQSQKMETIGTLAGGVAHDFNNLLTAIIGNADFGLHDSQANSELHESFSEIKKAATKASDLTDQLLSFSRRQVLKRRYLNLNHTIEDCLKLVRRIVGEDIEVKTTLDAKLHTVFADPGQVQQALMNLFTNARDAMPKGGKIFLEAVNVSPQQIEKIENLNSRNYVKIAIKDTGGGISKEHLPHIFEPFFTTKPVGKGTGLGLAVVYGVVKQHDGHVQVKSEAGKGTTFEIFLPSAPDKEAAKLEEKQVDHKLGAGETILIVEDDETVRSVAVRILAGLGYKVLVAENGAQAFSIFKTENENISLVVLDVVMPRESGPEIYKRMSAIRPNLPAVFVTGYDIHSKIPEFADDLTNKRIKMLQKPYTKTILANAIRDILAQGEELT
jgi:PAS domain S-box-containing protein